MSTARLIGNIVLAAPILAVVRFLPRAILRDRRQGMSMNWRTIWSAIYVAGFFSTMLAYLDGIPFRQAWGMWFALLGINAIVQAASAFRRRQVAIPVESPPA